MNNMPAKLRKECAEDPYYEKCCLHNKECSGRIEWHHALEFANKQIQRKFAIVPACKHHHENVAIFKKLFHWIALNRASEAELEEFKKANFKREKEYLNKLFKKNI